MKHKKSIKFTLSALISAFLIFAITKIIMPSMPLPTTREQILEPTNDALTKYLSVLENASLRKSGRLGCDIKTAELFKFEDQWKGLIRCREENNLLILSSDGEDKVQNTEDDLIITRALE